MLRVTARLRHKRKTGVISKIVGYEVSCSGVEMDSERVTTAKVNAMFRHTSTSIKNGVSGTNKVNMQRIASTGNTRLRYSVNKASHADLFFSSFCQPRREGGVRVDVV